MTTTRTMQGAVLVAVWAALSGAAPPARAFDLSLDVQPRAIRLGETTILSVTTHGLANANPISLPPIKGFQMSFLGQESSFSFGTGGQSSTVTFRYELTPTEAGAFEVGPFRIEAGGQTVDVSAIAVKVDPAGSPAGAPAGTSPGDLFFVRLQTRRTQVFNQEVFDLFLYLYFREYRMANEVQPLNLPTAGLSVQPLEEMQATQEMVNNEQFTVRRFRTKVRALTAGTFTLNPTLRIGVLVPRQRRQRAFDNPFFDSAFDNMFFGNYEQKQLDVPSQPIELTVLPLPPEGRPAGFSGAVGQFEFSAVVQPAEVKAGEPITIRTSITGEGNLDALTTPALLLGDSFKVYEAKLAAKDINPHRGAGTKTFEQVIIPTSQNVTNFPVLEFSYFDPEEARYEILRQGPFPLVIHPAPAGSKVVQLQPDQPAATKETRDIVYIKQGLPAWRRLDQPAWPHGPALVAMEVAPPLLLAGLLLAWRRKKELAEDVAKARRLRAPKAAQAGVSRAEAAMARSDAAAFHEALWESLAAYFGNRLNLAPGEVSSEAVLAALEKAGAPTEVIEKISGLFAASEQARFGGAAGRSAEWPGQLADLAAALKACERITL